MIKIGLTGGIGSGKTLVATVFELLGFPVFNADDVSKKILLRKSVKEKIINYFGNSILSEEKIDNGKLASIIFNNLESLVFLQSVLHPLVQESYLNWLEKQNSKVTIKEAAILFESGAYKHVDIVISISSSKELRINRVIKRDAVSKNHVLDRMKNQWKDSEREKKSDYVIYNNEEQMLLPQIISIYKDIKLSFK